MKRKWSGFQWGESEKGGAGQLGAVKSQGEGGLPQSHRAVGAESLGAVCVPSGNGWFPTEQAVGGKLSLNINSF